MEGSDRAKSDTKWEIKRKMPLARISDFSILMVQGKFMLNEGKREKNKKKKLFIFNVENKIKQKTWLSIVLLYGKANGTCCG